MLDFSKIKGFDWDRGNINKNLVKHNVTTAECEQVFFNDPLFIEHDIKHSTANEARYFILGETDERRNLMVVFTIRNFLIRPISARDMSKKERKAYEEKT